jgi:cytoskeletal protein RodZ
MKSRYIVLGLSLVLALALAVPALGGPTNPIASISASVKQTANKALNKAKRAQKTAESAQATANAANSAAASATTTAKTAQSTATTALTNAKTAQTTANEAKTAAAAAQTTANQKFGQTFSEFGTTEGPNTTSGFGIVNCPSGSSVTGGGYEVSGEGTNQVVASFTSTYGNAWLAALERIPGGTKTWSVRPVVVCAKP